MTAGRRNGSPCRNGRRRQRVFNADANSGVAIYATNADHFYVDDNYINVPTLLSHFQCQ